MKQFIITEEERSRILNMHVDSTKNQYLKEYDSYNDWGPGSETYDKDMERTTKSLQNLEKQKMEDEKNYHTPSYDPRTGRGWTPESLSDYVSNKYGVDVPEENMDSVRSIREYLENLSQESSDFSDDEDDFYHGGEGPGGRW
jgi:hypothetical protein